MWIPMVGEKSYTLLRSLGIHRIKTVQELEAQTMRWVLVEKGVSIWRKANVSLLSLMYDTGARVQEIADLKA